MSSRQWWQSRIARAYGVPLRLLVDRRLRSMHTAYSRRVRARRRRRS